MKIGNTPIIAPKKHGKGSEVVERREKGGEPLIRGKGRISEADPKIARHITLMHLMPFVNHIDLLSSYPSTIIHIKIQF